MICVGARGRTREGVGSLNIWSAADHWLEAVAGLFDLAWYGRHFLLEVSSLVSATYFCKIKREGTKHLGLKQLKELSSFCSSKLGSIFYYLLGVGDGLDSLLHVKIIPPWRTQTALIRKASWCIYFIPPPSVKNYAMYLIKRMQPFKSCTLLGIQTHFWQTFDVVLSGALCPPHTPHCSQLSCSSNCTHSAVLIASFLLDGGEAARGAAIRVI